jgi:hypothetical protein
MILLLFFGLPFFILPISDDDGSWMTNTEFVFGFVMRKAISCCAFVDDVSTPFSSTKPFLALLDIYWQEFAHHIEGLHPKQHSNTGRMRHVRHCKLLHNFPNVLIHVRTAAKNNCLSFMMVVRTMNTLFKVMYIYVG